VADPDTTYDDPELAKAIGGGDTSLPDLKLPSAADIPTVPLARLPGGSSSSSDSDEPKTFGEAFRKAYAKGAGTEFTWNGQKKVALKAGDKGADKLAPKSKPRATGAPPQQVKSTAPPSKTASSQTKSASAPTPVAKKTDKTPAATSTPTATPVRTSTTTPVRTPTPTVSPQTAQRQAAANSLIKRQEADRVRMKAQAAENIARYNARPKPKPTPAPVRQREDLSGLSPELRAQIARAQRNIDQRTSGHAKGGSVGFAKGGGVEVRGKTKAKRYAKGGSIDGCAKRGHTKAGRR
jgi:hypothetical protein